MRMTRERKMLFSVLSLGVLALGIDRVFFGATGPAQAGAAEERSASAPSPRAPGGAAGQRDHAAPASPPLDARTLEILERHDPSLAWDPFMAPSSWKVAGDAPVAGSAPADPAMDLVRSALPAFTGVMATSAGRRAILNGQPLSAGDALGSWTIATIEERAVVLAQGDARVRLELDAPQLHGRGTVDVASRDGR